MAHRCETRAVLAGQIIRRDEYLFRREFRRPIEIDRIACFVSRERDDLFHFGAQSRENDVLSAIDIGHDAFHWIIFGDRNMLQRRRVNDNIDVAHSDFEPAAIAEVANKKRMRGSEMFWAISHCLNSSREKTMTLRGLKSFKSHRRRPSRSRSRPPRRRARRDY